MTQDNINRTTVQKHTVAYNLMNDALEKGLLHAMVAWG